MSVKLLLGVTEAATEGSDERILLGIPVGDIDGFDDGFSDGSCDGFVLG